LEGGDINNVVNVPVGISALRLVFCAHPLAVDNEFVLMATRISHRKEEVELSVADSLHGHGLPLSESACNIYLITTVSPLEEVLVGSLLLWLSLGLHLLLVMVELLWGSHVLRLGLGNSILIHLM